MTDRSDKVTEEVIRAIAFLLPDEPIGNANRDALDRVKAVLGRDDVLEIMARAADQEEAAQKGEPSPWREDIAGNDEEWKSERRVAMLCALKAVGLA